MRKIRYKVLLMMILLVSLSLALQGQVTHQKALQVVQGQTQSLVSQTLLLGARQIAGSIRDTDRIFQSAYLSANFRDYLKALVREPENLSAPHRVSALQSVFLPLTGSRANVYSIIYVDPYGHVTYCTRDEAGHAEGTASLPESYRGVMEEAGWESGIRLLPTQRHMALKNHRGGGLPYVYTIARRIVNTEAQYRPAGWMFVTVALDELYTLSAGMSSAPQTRIFLLDFAGNVIFDSAGNLQSQVFPWEDTATLAVDGADFLLTKADVGETGWTLLCLVPEAYSEAAAESVSQSILQVVLASLCLAILLATLLSRAITGPLEQLTQTMSQVSLSSLDTRAAVHGRDETAQLSRAFNLLLNQLQEAIAHEYQLKLENKEAQLRLLQAQLNPHFMANVLQSISSLALIHAVSEVNVMAKSLGRLLNASIKAKGSTAPLGQELENVNNYLAIQGIRFGDRLHVTLDVPQALLTAIVPRIVLQPMVENALIHGFENRPEKGELLIRCAQEEQSLVLEVTDNGQGMDPERLQALWERIHGNAPNGGGIGLPNLYARLQLLYGGGAELRIESEWDIGTSVQVKIPLEWKKEV